MHPPGLQREGSTRASLASTAACVGSLLVCPTEIEEILSQFKAERMDDERFRDDTAAGLRQ